MLKDMKTDKRLLVSNDVVVESAFSIYTAGHSPALHQADRGATLARCFRDVVS